MPGNKFNDYKHVDAVVIEAAARCDHEPSYSIIFERYEGYIRKLIVNQIRRNNMPLSLFSFEDLYQSIWIDMKDCVSKFRPR